MASIMPALIQNENLSMSKVAVVTGGTSGIGRATAKSLSAQGYKVYASGAFDEELDHCRQDTHMLDITLDKLDVADKDSVRDYFARLERLDALVNCAGIGRGTEEYSEPGFLNTLDINLNGTMRCCYAARELLAQQGGAIVNIASIMSFFGTATGPAYAASKGAIVQFTKSIALAWARDNIRINAIAPGWVDTQMTATLQSDNGYNQKVLQRTPMGRWGRPEEIANGIEFLLSDKASFITGTVLAIDGGYMASS